MAPYMGLRGSSLSRAIMWLAVCPAFVCYGYNLSVAGGLLTLESFVRAFPQLDTLHTTGTQQHQNSTIQGTVVALFTIGGMFGSMSCVYLGDKLGRRRVILLASAVTIIGAILMATSFNLGQFIAARLILGLGTGGYVATVPVWQAEIANANKRGAQVVTAGIFIGAGVSMALWIDLGFYFVAKSSVSWRFPLAFQVLLLLAVMIFISVFPESPRWLVKTGRQDEAREILAALSDLEPNSELVSAELRDIENSLSQSGSLSWKAMLTMGKQRLLHRTVLAATVQMFQQICGINVTTMYATTIFEQYLGLSPINSRILAASMCLTQPFGGFLAFSTIDRLGRRALMLWSAVGMAVSLAIVAGTTSVTDNTGALVVAVIFIFAFQFIYTVGFSGLTFLYATEMAPLQLRAAISAISTAVVWIFNFLLAEVTPVGFNSIGCRYFIIFAVLNAVIVPIVYFFFPETNGRSLEEIDEIFLQSKSIWDSQRIARALPRVQVADAVDARTSSEDEKASKA